MVSLSIHSRLIRKILFILLVSSAFYLPGCGGGGGGGGGITPSSIQYAGVITQAVVDQSNASELATSAFQGGQTGSALFKLENGGVSNGSVNDSDILKITTILENAVQGKLAAELSSLKLGSILSKSYLVHDTGSCGGSVSGTINYDPQTGAFSGTVAFRSYCDQGIAISGTVYLRNGQLDLSTGDIQHMDMRFTLLRASSGVHHLTMAGTVTVDVVPPVTTETIVILVKDDTTLLVFQTDYVVNKTDGGGYLDFTITGRFYHPIYGYVDLSTETPLHIVFMDNWPSSGVLVITGAGGTAARLTALSSTTFMVEADLDGDGNYDGPPVDFSSGTLYWADY